MTEFEDLDSWLAYGEARDWTTPKSDIDNVVVPREYHDELLTIERSAADSDEQIASLKASVEAERMRRVWQTETLEQVIEQLIDRLAAIRPHDFQ